MVEDTKFMLYCIISVVCGYINIFCCQFQYFQYISMLKGLLNSTRTLDSSICHSLPVNPYLSIHIGIQVIDDLPLNSYQFCMQISVTFHEFCVQLYQHFHINFILKQDCFSGNDSLLFDMFFSLYWWKIWLKVFLCSPN